MTRSLKSYSGGGGGAEGGADAELAEPAEADSVDEAGSNAALPAAAKDDEAAADAALAVADLDKSAELEALFGALEPPASGSGREAVAAADEEEEEEAESDAVLPAAAEDAEAAADAALTPAGFDELDALEVLADLELAAGGSVRGAAAADEEDEDQFEAAAFAVVSGIETSSSLSLSGIMMMSGDANDPEGAPRFAREVALESFDCAEDASTQMPSAARVMTSTSEPALDKEDEARAREALVDEADDEASECRGGDENALDELARGKNKSGRKVQDEVES
jgi:hypothetical protein